MSIYFAQALVSILKTSVDSACMLSVDAIVQARGASRRHAGAFFRHPAVGLADWEFFSSHSGHVVMARRMSQNGAPAHEIEHQGRWKQGGCMVGRYTTRGESTGSPLRYL